MCVRACERVMRGTSVNGPVQAEASAEGCRFNFRAMQHPAAHHAHAASPPPPARLAARYGARDTIADASDDAMRRWRNNFAQEHVPSHCPRSSAFCRLEESLYYYDRCWNPRYTCAVAVGNHTTIVVPQHGKQRAGTPH